jgi:uncharacterized repeat protein (TIGR03803 family)
MRINTFPIGLTARLSVFAMTVMLTGPRAAAQEKVLHNFGNGADGISPVASLIFDGAGNLYGTTAAGGSHGYGTVFELMPASDGGWNEKILHDFNNDNGRDGEGPYAGLIFDSAGNLYGTTFSGGAYGDGTVFELTPEAGGWTEKILHNFNQNSSDGYWPYYANLIVDASGNLYGTASSGGPSGGGIAFELTPATSGPWTERVLHAFSTTGGDGYYPEAGLIFDSAGNLYGTTNQGGISTYGGTVFELSPKSGGQWTETMLLDCNIQDGWGPMAGLIFDSTGNLYTTTQHLGTGAGGGGTVFELSPNGHGAWTNRALQSFSINGSGGFYPSGVVLDAAGNLYGTAANGGTYSGGVVFELSSGKRGSERILLNFSGKDGYGPAAGLILDSHGNLYGITSGGGAYGGGVVFEITP